MPNLLLIESDPRIYRALQKSLAAENYTVDTAKSAQRGLRLSQPYKYDLVILDSSLSDGSGLKICQELREKEIKAPIMILMAEDSSALRIKAFDNGADDCLVKPFDIKELTARLRVLLRRKKIIVSEEMKIDDLVVDVAHREARRGARKIHLNSKEYKILTYLLEHRQRIITRQEIKNYVWGKRTSMRSNTLDAHIRYLRRKISNNGKKKQLIYTVRGVGYRIIE